MTGTKIPHYTAVEIEALDSRQSGQSWNRCLYGPPQQPNCVPDWVAGPWKAVCCLVNGSGMRFQFLTAGQLDTEAAHCDAARGQECPQAAFYLRTWI